MDVVPSYLRPKKRFDMSFFVAVREVLWFDIFSKKSVRMCFTCGVTDCLFVVNEVRSKGGQGCGISRILFGVSAVGTGVFSHSCQNCDWLSLG